jgi:hypothetical protein
VSVVVFVVIGGGGGDFDDYGLIMTMTTLLYLSGMGIRETRKRSK